MSEIATWPNETQIASGEATPNSGYYSIPRRVLITIRQEMIQQPMEEMPTEPKASIDVGTLPDDRLHLRRPLSVKVTLEPPFYVASCDEFDEFGFSNNFFGAVDDLRMAVADLYWSLKEEKSNLGTDLSNLWIALKAAIDER